MSEIEDRHDDLTELKNKINRCNKNIKELMEMVKSIDAKMGMKPNWAEEKEKDDDKKEKINMIFEKKQIGRPVGTWESKREQYHDMLAKGKIKQPKQDTLDYYKINKHPDDGSYHLSG